MRLLNIDDPLTRQLMVDEFEFDLLQRRLYLSPRLTPRGIQLYPPLLRKALESRNAHWLAERILHDDLLESYEERRKPKGGYCSVKVPHDAHETLAEGEMNRFYVRGVCRTAIENGWGEVEVYRARDVLHPRRESELLIGSLLDAAALLRAVRADPRVDVALRIPPGPNSGLSVRLPRRPLYG